MLDSAASKYSLILYPITMPTPYYPVNDPRPAQSTKSAPALPPAHPYPDSGEKPAQPPQVAVQNDSLAESIDRLDKATETLIMRLSPILRTDEPVKTATDTASLPILVPLADVLRQHARRVGAIARRLEDVLERVEL